LKENPDLKISESSPTTLSGMPAHKLTYTKKGWTHLEIITVRADFNYDVLYAAENNNCPIYPPIAQEIIKSFEFIG
jgi:hypothetical protein